MNDKLAGLVFGASMGFVFAWARLTDPAVIRNMLLLREFDVFLLMGAAIAVAGLGVRVLRAVRVRALATGEPIGWAIEKPRSRHVVGSLLFGVGWGVAGTCPGPVAAMLGEGRLGGLAVAAGLVGGIALQGMLERRSAARRLERAVEMPGAAGL